MENIENIIQNIDKILPLSPINIFKRWFGFYKE